MINSTYRIFLLNEELDCEDLDFSTTFSISDASDISKRKDNISKNIKLKATPNNNRIFGNLYNLSRVTDDEIPEQLYYNYSPSVGVSCKIYENSTVIFTGELRIIEINVDGFGNYEYTAVVTGALVNLFAKIGESLLTDIGGFDVTHDYNFSTINLSWYKSNNLPFVYPLIDYGVNTGQTIPNKFEVSNIRTGIYLKTYFDKIFSNYGYTYSGDFTESEIFNNAYIPFNGQGFNKVNTGALFNSSLTAYTLTYPLSPNAGLNSSVPLQPVYSNTIVENWGLSVDNRVVTGYRFKKNITTSITVRLSFSATTDYVDPFFNLAIGNRIYTIGQNFPVIDTYEYKLPIKSYSAGDLLMIPVTLPTSPNAETSILMTYDYADIQIGDDVTTSQSEIKISDVVSLIDVLPQDVKVKDFIKSVQQFFNLYIVENPNKTQDLIIEPFDNFFEKCSNPKEYALDWSNKVDFSKGYGQAFNIELPAKYNFKFKEDTDYFNEFYKDRYNETYGNFSITNSKGKSEEKNVEVTFSPTVIVKSGTDDKDIPTIFKGELTKKQAYKSNLRILFFNGVSSCNNYQIVQNDLGSESEVALLNTYPLSHHILNVRNQAVFNMQFGLPKEILGSLPLNADIFELPNLYTLFYKNQIVEANDPNVYTITLDVFLTSNDINQLDMRVPVFIASKNGSGYFKIISVNYYNSVQTSQVVLQKINV